MMAVMAKQYNCLFESDAENMLPKMKVFVRVSKPAIWFLYVSFVLMASSLRCDCLAHGGIGYVSLS